MKKMFLSGLTIGFLFLGIVGIASAIPLTLTFEATGFSETIWNTGAPAPDSTVSGTIVYEAASLGGLIQSLSSIEMTINGHVYSVSDLGFESPGPSGVDRIFGGISSGFNNGADDFILQFYRGNAAGEYQSGWNFLYTTAGYPRTAWETYNFDISIIDGASANPVPEPATMMLFGIGLLGLAGVSRRKK